MQSHSAVAADAQHSGAKRGPLEPPALNGSPRATRQRTAPEERCVGTVTRCRFAVRRVGEPAIYAPETPRHPPELLPTQVTRDATTHVDVTGLAAGVGTTAPLRLAVPTPSPVVAAPEVAVSNGASHPRTEAHQGWTPAPLGNAAPGMPSLAVPGLTESFPRTRQLNGDVGGPASGQQALAERHTTASGTQTQISGDVRPYTGANPASSTQPRAFSAFAREPIMQDIALNDSISHISDAALSSDRNESGITPLAIPAGLRQEFIIQPSPEPTYEDGTAMFRDAGNSARSIEPMDSELEARRQLRLPDEIFNQGGEGVWAMRGAEDGTLEPRNNGTAPTPRSSARGAVEFCQQFPTPSCERVAPTSDMSVDTESRAATLPGETSLESEAQLIPVEQRKPKKKKGLNSIIRQTGRPSAAFKSASDRVQERRENTQQRTPPVVEEPIVYPRYTASLQAADVPSDGYPKNYASRLVEGLRIVLAEGQTKLMEEWGLTDVNASIRSPNSTDNQVQIQKVIAKSCDKLSRKAYQSALRTYGAPGASGVDRSYASNYVDENAADEEAQLEMLRNQNEQVDRQLHELRLQKLGDLASQLESCGGRHIMDDVTTPIDSDQFVDVMNNADEWLMQNLEQLEKEAKDFEQRERACAQRAAELDLGQLGKSANGNFLRGLAPPLTIRARA